MQRESLERNREKRDREIPFLVKTDSILFMYVQRLFYLEKYNLKLVRAIVTIDDSLPIEMLFRPILTYEPSLAFS